MTEDETAAGAPDAPSSKRRVGCAANGSCDAPSTSNVITGP